MPKHKVNRKKEGRHISECQCGAISSGDDLLDWGECLVCGREVCPPCHRVNNGGLCAECLNGQAAPVTGVISHAGSGQ